MRHRHPSVVEGSISADGQQYPIKDGVVDCPATLGQELGMEPLEAPESTDKTADTAGDGDKKKPNGKGKKKTDESADKTADTAGE